MATLMRRFGTLSNEPVGDTAAHAGARRRMSGRGKRRRLLLLRKRREGVGMIGIPARKRGPVLDDVTRRPKDAPFVEAPRHVIIRTQDVEVAGVDTLDHEVDGLFRRPR